MHLDLDGKQLFYAALTGAGLGFAARASEKKETGLAVLALGLSYIGFMGVLQRQTDRTLEHSRITFSDGSMITLKEVSEMGGDVCFDPHGGLFIPQRRSHW